jgi:hypothetical protein
VAQVVLEMALNVVVEEEGIYNEKDLHKDTQSKNET